MRSGTRKSQPTDACRTALTVRESRDEPLEVTRQLVDFEIDPQAGSGGPERAVLEGVRNDVHTEDVSLNGVDGEAHAVDRHRPLGRKVARELLGNLDLQPPRARIARHRGDARYR